MCVYVHLCMFASVCVFASVHVNFHVIDYYITDSGHSSFNHLMYTSLAIFRGAKHCTKSHEPTNGNGRNIIRVKQVEIIFNWMRINLVVNKLR